MNKIVLTLALSIALYGSAHAGLLDAVTDTAQAITTAKESGLNSDQAVLEVVKTKVQAGTTTKEQVKSKLGEPKATSTVDGNEIWKYDISSISDKAGSAMTLANTLGSDTKKAQKIVTLKFEGDAVKSYELVEGTLTN